jgi:hypothetical protein
MRIFDFDYFGIVSVFHWPTGESIFAHAKDTV